MHDPRAIIDPGARLGRDVTVGPWSLIGPDVEIGDGCWIGPHVILRGPTRIGRGNRIYQFSTVGEDTPALAYGGEATVLEIGDENVIREGVTIHRGLAQHGGITRVGSRNLLMAYVHVGHDCVVGDHVVMANNVGLSGHVQVGDWANLGGYAGVPQFRSIGAHAFVGGMSLVTKDVPAFVSVNGNPAVSFGLNRVGLERRGFAPEAVAALRRAYRTVYREGLRVAEALERLEPEARAFPEVAVFRDSVAASKHGIVRERRGGGADRDSA